MSDNVEHQYRVGEFEGPLDLLLFLIKKSEVSIYDIPIAAITEQYLVYTRYATEIGLADLTEFYVMASTLLHIKSQTLLPVEIDIEDDEGDPRQELVERLIEHQKIKKLATAMAEQRGGSEWEIEREARLRSLPIDKEKELWESVDIWELLETFSTLMGSLSAERIIDLYEEVTVNEKVTLIHEYIDTRGEFRFDELLHNSKSVMEVVCAFLAVLELVKSRRVSVLQNSLFGDILIRPAPDSEETRNG